LDFAPLKPSEYIHDRLLSTGDKLAQVSTRPDIPRIIELSTDTEGAVKQYQVPIDRPLFQPTPSAIALQSFEPFVTYEVVINFRNIDKVRSFKCLCIAGILTIYTNVHTVYSPTQNHAHRLPILLRHRMEK
jgi:hypothetical protein